MNKKISEALNSLDIKWLDNDEFALETERDLDEFINRSKGRIIDNELKISELKNYIKKLEDLIDDIQDINSKEEENTDIFNQIKHQIKVEEYKKLNPGKEIF